jgi:hypothetical protein
MTQEHREDRFYVLSCDSEDVLGDARVRTPRR